MPNWCSTAYVIEGDAQEVKNLYELMKGLQERKEPSVKSGFGTTWLGCLVDALGENWHKVNCRGDWSNLKMVDDTLRFTTETAWAPCDETLNLVCRKFPSLSYYYQTEEPGMVIYETNDSEGKFFPEKYHVEIYTADEEFYIERFSRRSAIFEWFGEVSGQPVKTQNEAEELVEQWRKKNKNAFCYINRYQIVD